MKTVSASSTTQVRRVSSFGFLLVCMVIPYMIGVYISSRHIDTMEILLAPWLGSESEKCYHRFLKNMHKGQLLLFQDNPFQNLSLVVHRNGEATPCGETLSADLMAEFQRTIESLTECPDTFDDKYETESLLSRVLHSLVASSCHSTEQDRPSELGFYGFCDMGESRTPILLDHDKLVPVETHENGKRTTYLPCHFHTRDGLRPSSSLTLLADYARRAQAPENGVCLSTNDGRKTCSAENPPRRELHLYAVPAGRMFMFAPSYVGEIINLPHVKGGDPSKPVYLEVLSLSPRVFDLHNFFTADESKRLVARALKETRESHRIKRSSIGPQAYNIDSRRTSESGYDTNGMTAMVVKRRSFDVLGFDEYLESHADGLQMLRYNVSTSYLSHLDWIEGSDELEHDYDSSGKGGNRFATILLYMTSTRGGETVFTEAWPVGEAEEDHVDLKTAIRQLRESGDASSILREGSWEFDLVAKCRSRLSIVPHPGKSILFYSQFPNGTEDPASLHGGCPVLEGQKYAANLWVWSTPRRGFKGSPVNPQYGEKEDNQVPVEDNTVDDDDYDYDDPPKIATFRNTGTNAAYEKAELYFGDKFWSKLGTNDPPVTVQTFKGHKWKVKVNGITVAAWSITNDTDDDPQFEIPPVKEEDNQVLVEDNTVDDDDLPKIVTFRNTGTNAAYEKAELYFEDKFWSKLGTNDPQVTVRTFKGHIWKVKVNGITVAAWSITKDTDDDAQFEIPPGQR